MISASILITNRDQADSKALPQVIEENIASVVHHHPQLAHTLFDADRIHRLLKDRFPREVQRAFERLRPYAYQADLARYCILYEYGGLYADLSYHFLKPLPIDPQRMVVFRDFMWSSPWDASNGVIATPPRHPALAFAIQAVCANVRSEYYGPTVLCPTGPALFGKAIATTCAAEDLIAGQAKMVNRDELIGLAPHVHLHEADALHCLTLDNEVVAVKRKPLFSEGIASLGIANGNGYAELWHQRAVYADCAMPQRSSLLSRMRGFWT